MVLTSPACISGRRWLRVTLCSRLFNLWDSDEVSPDHYDDHQTSVLQAAHSAACKELCIGEMDNESREHVAAMMIAFARNGHIEIEKLKAFAVHQFKSWRFPEAFLAHRLDE